MPATSSHPDRSDKAVTLAEQDVVNKQRGRYVPWVIAAFYMTFMSVLIGFVFIAYAHPPADSTEEAYEKGLAYNDTLSRAQKQAALGWQSKIRYSQGVISFQLRDRANAAVTHARVRAWFVHPGTAQLDRSFDLVEDGSGTYHADARLPATGLWTVHVTAAKPEGEYQAVTQTEAD